MKKQPDSSTNKNHKRLPYVDFEVENFRCFSRLKIDDLERVNLIAGLNNVGKTAFLEAVFLHLGGDNLSVPARINSWRGIPEIIKNLEIPGVFSNTLFRGFDDQKPIILKGTASNGKLVKLTISKTPHISSTNQASKITSLEMDKESGYLTMEYQDSSGKKYISNQLPESIKIGEVIHVNYPLPKFKASHTGIFLYSKHLGGLVEDIERFSNLRMKNKDGLLIESLQIMEKRIRKLEILSPQGHSMLYAYMEGNDQPVMLTLLGDGIRRITSLILAIAEAADSVVLVDEIENGIHHSVLGPLWEVIGEAANLFNTQIFATTHSLECIQAAHDAFKARDHYCFRLHRFDRSNDSIKVVTYDQEALEGALTIPLEVRGYL